MISDPLANAMTKIRNASRAKHPTVDVVAARLTERVLVILKQEGFIRNYKPVGETPRRQFRVYLKYTPTRQSAIAQLRNVSMPGRRNYRRVDELPRVLGGMGRAILTTSKGVMTDREARQQHIGGEVLCHVW